MTHAHSFPKALLLKVLPTNANCFEVLHNFHKLLNNYTISRIENCLNHLKFKTINQTLFGNCYENLKIIIFSSMKI
jgi:hypothetical protein